MTAGASSLAAAVLFKLTPTESLVPCSAESLLGRVGTASAEGGAEVPMLPPQLLHCYRACGRACGLALANGHMLGLPFAQYFLRLVVQPDSAARATNTMADFCTELHGAQKPHRRALRTPNRTLQQLQARPARSLPSSTPLPPGVLRALAVELPPSLHARPFSPLDPDPEFSVCVLQNPMAFLLERCTLPVSKSFV